jgi:tetratricopeptide (TPR) repeat protein
VLQPGYLPGKRFEEHFSQKFGQLSNKAFFPDGRTRQFAYQEGQLSSECTRNGSLKCVDCHDPHSQSYRDVNGTQLTGRLDNRQCTSCHASKSDPIVRHTKHRADSPGSQCVACHMPYLQQPLLGDALHFARSDHTIPVPRPRGDSVVGIQNACSQCHGDQPIATLEAQVAAWYGELKPRSPYIARLDSAIVESDPSDHARLALMPEGIHPMAQFAGLELYFERLTPDMPWMNADDVRKLKELAQHPDVDIRALALASLHFARGGDRGDPEVRAFLAQSLAQLGEDDAVIRRRWAMALGFRGDLYARLRRHEQSRVSYHKALEIQPRDAAILLQIAIAAMNAGDYGNALRYVEQGLTIDQNEPRAYVITGLVLQQLREPERAVRAFQRATEVNPHDARAAVYLGDALLAQQQVLPAIEAYRRAVALDPGLASASFKLARSYMIVGNNRSALQAVRQGLAFAPNDPEGRETLTYLERALSSRPISRE